MKNGGAAHRNIEAPRNFDSASRCRHPEHSRGIFLALRSVSHKHRQGNDALVLRISAFTHPSFSGLQERFLASLEMTIRETDVFESPVTRDHSSLLSNLWCIASKTEAPRIDMEHHDPANAHSFEAHVGSKERQFAFSSH